MSEYSDFYFVNGNLSLGEFAFSRAYFKFKNFQEMLIFKDKFDDYVFMDSKGNEYPCVVEFAYLQKMPRPSNDSKKTKQDIKMNTIDSEPDYIAFVQELNNNNSTSPPPCSADALLEEIENNKLCKDKDSQLTPLLEFIGKRREEKIKMLEEKKRKKDETKKKKTTNKEMKAKQQQKVNKPAAVKPKQEATYVIQVKTDSQAKPAQKSTNNTVNLDGKKGKAKTGTEEKAGKQKESNTSKPARIRNKDRPAREIYRPGTKPKAQQTSAPATPANPATSATPAAPAPPTGTNTGTVSETATTSKPTQVKVASDKGEKNTNNPKFKNRVFTRTKN